MIFLLSLMSFANSQSQVLVWRVELTFPTSPPVATSVDVNSTGNAPSSGGTAHASWTYMSKSESMWSQNR